MNGKRVCLLTGAGGSLGTLFCTRYAHVYDIVAVYRNRLPAAASQEVSFVDPLAPQSAASLNRHSVFTVRADVREESDLEMVVDTALERFGRIDLLVNSAVHSVWGPIGSVALAESMLEQYRVNAIAPVRLAAIVSDRYWRHRGAAENASAGRNVVNVSSTSGVYVYPESTGQSVYAATKAALNMLTCYMAEEFRQIGVRVNATAPTSFQIVPAWQVADAIVGYDHGRENGQILVMDHDGNYVM